MKKFVKILSVIAVLVIIAAVATRFFMPSFFYDHIYPFNRIRGNVALTIDGKDIPLSECDIKCINKFKAQKLHIRGNRIKTRAGEYGRYKFIIAHDGIEIPFYFYQANCWNCEDFDISFSIDTANNTVSCTGWTRGLEENGLKEEKRDIDLTLNFDDISPEGICIASV